MPQDHNHKLARDPYRGVATAASMASSGVVNVRSAASSAPIASTRRWIGSELPRLYRVWHLTV